LRYFVASIVHSLCLNYLGPFGHIKQKGRRLEEVVNRYTHML